MIESVGYAVSFVNIVSTRRIDPRHLEGLEDKKSNKHQFRLCVYPSLENPISGLVVVWKRQTSLENPYFGLVTSLELVSGLVSGLSHSYLLSLVLVTPLLNLLVVLVPSCLSDF